MWGGWIQIAPLVCDELVIYFVSILKVKGDNAGKDGYEKDTVYFLGSPDAEDVVAIWYVVTDGVHENL